MDPSEDPRSDEYVLPWKRRKLRFAAAAAPELFLGKQLPTKAQALIATQFEALGFSLYSAFQMCEAIFAKLSRSLFLFP